jgi:hypothetical protein
METGSVIAPNLSASAIGANAGFVIAFILWRRLPLMRERVEELGREAEVSILADAGDPPSRCCGRRRTVKRRVDLNGGEVSGDIGQFVESTRGGLWVYDSFPVLVLPHCWPDSNHPRQSCRRRPPLLQPRRLAKEHPFRSIPGTPLFHDPALEGGAANSINLPGRHDLEHRRQGRLRQSDRPLLLRFHDEQVCGIECARGLDVYAVPSSFRVRHGHRAPAHGDLSIT